MRGSRRMEEYRHLEKEGKPKLCLGGPAVQWCREGIHPWPASAAGTGGSNVLPGDVDVGAPEQKGDNENWDEDCQGHAAPFQCRLRGSFRHWKAERGSPPEHSAPPHRPPGVVARASLMGKSRASPPPPLLQNLALAQISPLKSCFCVCVKPTYCPGNARAFPSLATKSGLRCPGRSLF